MADKPFFTVMILAGGKSTRMKEDKGLVVFEGRKLVESVIAVASTLTDNITLLTPNPSYRQFGYPCIEDDLKDKGPLGGIYTGLLRSGTRKNLFLGCDMPFLTESLLSALLAACGEEDALLAEHNGKAEPLCAVYDRSCLPHFRQSLETGRLKITDALQDLNCRLINFDNASWFRGNEFTNINTAAELGRYDRPKN